MKFKVKGFTLIELLIVVAIIAILAAIAVPNFLEAQVRSKVSRAKTDMRTLATALEAYYIDNNDYAGSATPIAAGDGFTVNSTLAANGGAWNRITFQTYRPQSNPDGMGNTLTTPIAYITSLPADPFADTKAATFGYFNSGGGGWLTWSYGPDTDEKVANGEIQKYLMACSWNTDAVNKIDLKGSLTASAPCTIYSPNMTNPNADLTAGPLDGSDFAYTYDPTNGTNSKGDVWRVKQ
jgi:type II secretion system protein G